MAHELQLPLAVVGPADVMRLRRTLEQFDDGQQQAALRAKSGAPTSEQQAGQLLRELATLNKCDLTARADRQALIAQLETALKMAPTITMSFATEPSTAFMTKITGWFRESIHPSLLIRVGLQPNIAAGCTMRTSDKLYDFSLRGKFSEQRSLLIAGIRKAAAAPAPVAAAAPAASEAQGTPV